MITLYGFGPAFGLPDASPFVTKVAILLKMAGLSFQLDLTGLPRAPKGKLPYIDDDGARIADSTFIRKHIEEKYGFDFDRGLSAEQKAVSWAFEKMAEDNLYWILLDSRWTRDVDFDTGPRVFFNPIPALVRPFVIAVVRRKIRQALYAQGIGRHSPQDIATLGSRSIAAIATHLGNRPFFMGTEPTGVDATIFAMTAGAMCPHFTSPLREAAERHANLRSYIERMMVRYYPEPDELAWGRAVQ
jgi:glutathione S-transferase